MNATTMHYPTKRILLLGFIITVAAISAPALAGSTVPYAMASCDDLMWREAKKRTG